MTGYRQFGLTLMVNHACNLRCDYCYTGEKTSRPMSPLTGRKSIDRALASLVPGGRLELGFFGGEPLLEADLISDLIAYARTEAAASGHHVQPGMTTNGTVVSEKAWEILTLPDLDLTVSHDGLPHIHNRHRPKTGGGGSSEAALRTMRSLRQAGKGLRVQMVVRPDTAASLPDGMRFLFGEGITDIALSLDLWTAWLTEDGRRLESAIAKCARLWVERLPHVSVSWFDEKAAELARIPSTETAACGFGAGAIAVAPSGNLYPCERLISEDQAWNPSRLDGHALAGSDFLEYAPASPRSEEECSVCAMQAACNTTCRCSNYVRTGDVKRPDGLLCLLNQACLRETAAVLRTRQVVPSQEDRHV